MNLMQKKNPDSRPPLRVISSNSGKPDSSNRNAHKNRASKSGEITITEDDLFIPELGRDIDPEQDATANQNAGQASQDDWQWVLLAHLSLETPLRALKRHGETMEMQMGSHGPREPEIPDIDSPYLSWIPASADGTNTHGDPIIDSSASVTMDIHPNEASPLRYRKFLIRLRGILESSDTPTQKRQAIAAFVNDEQWLDIVTLWGSLDEFLDRLIPPFLMALKKHLGIPQTVVDTLKTIGIVSRIDLARALDHGFPGIASLENLGGIGPATVGRLQHYYLNEEKLDDNAREVLKDPYMQTVF